MKSAIAISTYFGPKTHPKRLKIFQQCIDTLISSGYPGKIFLIDDCSTIKDHLAIVRGKGIWIIERPSNGGESKVKNTSLKILMGTDAEYFFVSDDDMIFKPGWWQAYIDAMRKMDMEHMAYTIDGMKSVQENYKGIDVTHILAPTTNGCFLTMTRKVVEKLGGWPIGVTNFGHGHENFSMRCLKYDIIPFYCDLADKKKYIELNRKSNPYRSSVYRKDEIDRNLYLLENPKMYEPIIE